MRGVRSPLMCLSISGRGNAEHQLTDTLNCHIKIKIETTNKTNELDCSLHCAAMIVSIDN